MLYSVHNPVTGAFDYFEAQPDVPINDDLPTPRWGSDVRTRLGVPSSKAARPLPPSARPVGSGALPVGLMSSGQTGLWTGTEKGIPSGLGTDEADGRPLPYEWIALTLGCALAAVSMPRHKALFGVGALVSALVAYSKWRG